MVDVSMYLYLTGFASCVAAIPDIINSIIQMKRTVPY
jgi:hypothetical protein